MDRRCFLQSAALAALGVALGPQAARRLAAQDTQELRGQGETGALFNPSAVQQRAPTDSLDNSSYIQALEKRLKCQCGCNLDIYTCRTTDFTCTVSPALHRDILAWHSEGKTAQQILDEFVARYGETALMAPKPEGFNLAGYLVPGLATVAAGGLLLARFLRRPRGARPTPVVATEPTATTEELARLRQALSEVDD